MAHNAWLSTKAFSVYNVLFQANHPMAAGDIASLLRERWRADVDDEYVSLGVGYLLAKQMIGTTLDGKLGLTKPGKRVKRVNDDVDLDWAES